MKKIFFFIAALTLSFAAQAAVHTCTPAANSLSWCLTQADTLILTDGVYEEAYTISIEKPGVLIKAAEGAKPVIKLTGEWTSLQLYATITFDGITVDGTGVCYYPISAFGSDAGTYTFKNCEFTGWTYWAISNHYESNTHVDNVLIENCIFHDAAGSAVYFNDDAYEIVKDLKGKVLQCATTNGTKIAQERKLANSGLIHLLDGVFISDVVGIEKPGKGFFDAVFDEIGTYDPAEVIIIGDSLTSDIRGGNNAGILTCWYNPHKKINDQQVQVDYEISDLSEVLDICGTADLD